MPVQDRFAGVQTLQQWFFAGIHDPVDGSKANFLEWLARFTHGQWFHRSTGSNGQELCSKADAEHRFALLIPEGEPVQFTLQPWHVWLQPIVDAHGAAEHQGDGVRDVSGLGQRACSMSTVTPSWDKAARTSLTSIGQLQSRSYKREPERRERD